MSNKYSGGCDHIHTHSDAEPIDNHTCHCSVCKRVTGQPTTHVVFFRHGDVDVDNLDGLNRQPFNDQNPDGPLELCICATCGTPIMLDDRQRRDSRDCAEPDGLRSGEPARDLSRLLRPGHRRPEANRRPTGARGPAPRICVA
ncbi:MAG: GFA family protein [Rhodospirillales bacterium]|nr:GFA family protein [Rhodospirillales bacterium]